MLERLALLALLLAVAPPYLLGCPETLLVQLTVAEAMAWARDNLLTERPELFMKGSSV